MNKKPKPTATSPGSSVEPATNGLDLFIPIDDTTEQYAGIAKMLRGRVANKLAGVTLAFPDVSANGIASAPSSLNPALVRLVQGLPKRTKVGVAYDGSSAPYTSLAGEMSHPLAYARSIVQTQDTMAKELGRNLNGGAAGDWEFPTEGQQNDVTTIVRFVQKAGIPMTVEIGPGNDQGINYGALAATGANFNVMSLDDPLGSEPAEPNAPGATTISDLESLQREGVSASHESYELPLYAQTFPDATGFGQNYNMQATAEVPDSSLAGMHMTHVVDNLSNLSSSGVVGNTLYSYESNRDISEIARAAAAIGVRNVTAWEADQAIWGALMAAEGQGAY